MYCSSKLYSCIIQLNSINRGKANSYIASSPGFPQQTRDEDSKPYGSCSNFSPVLYHIQQILIQLSSTVQLRHQVTEVSNTTEWGPCTGDITRVTIVHLVMAMVVFSSCSEALPWISRLFTAACGEGKNGKYSYST